MIRYHGPLLIVAPAHPEDIRAALVGQNRGGGAGCDLKDGCFLVDLRRRDGGVRAEVPGDKHYAVADQFLGGHDGLVRVAKIICDNELYLLAEHTPSSV